MAVGIITPQQEESGIDKFLRRLGGIAQLVQTGANIYNIPAQRRALEAEEKLKAQEAELYPQKFEQALGDQALDRRYKEAQIAELSRKPEKEAEERQFRREELNLKKAEKQEAAAEKKKTSLEEVDYRQGSILSSLDKLDEIVKQYGTFEVFGPQKEQMNQLIYNAALDYAKLVDPQSVAREGEVAAAQKYALPIQGLGVSNESARQLIADMKAKTIERGGQIRKSKGLSELIKEPTDKTIKTPKAGDIVDGYRFKGGNPSDQTAWERVK